MSDTEAQSTPSEGRPPKWWEVAALLVIVPALVACARFVVVDVAISGRWAAIFAGVFAAVVGVPALAWSFERARVGIVALGLTGAIAGAVPPMLLALSGLVGFLARGGVEYATWALPRGISLPIYGPATWPGFAGLVGWCAAIGLSSGVVFALLVPAKGWTQPLAWAWTLLILLAVVGLGGLYR